MGLHLWLLWQELCWKPLLNSWNEVSQCFSVLEITSSSFVALIGLHPTVISEAFQHASEMSVSILQNMSLPVDLKDRNALIQIAKTSLNSKVR